VPISNGLRYYTRKALRGILRDLSLMKESIGSLSRTCHSKACTSTSLASCNLNHGLPVTSASLSIGPFAQQPQTALEYICLTTTNYDFVESDPKIFKDLFTTWGRDKEGRNPKIKYIRRVEFLNVWLNALRVCLYCAEELIWATFASLDYDKFQSVHDNPPESILR